MFYKNQMIAKRKEKQMPYKITEEIQHLLKKEWKLSLIERTRKVKNETLWIRERNRLKTNKQIPK